MTLEPDVAELFGAPSARTLSRSERTVLPCLSPLVSL
jgi:hypothetical protein